MDFPGVDPDAPKRSRDVANPKKRMLGSTPSIFFQVDAPNTCKQTSLATPKIFIYVAGAKDDKNKKVSLF